MKKVLNIIIFWLLANVAIAQVPQGLPYQAVARNSAGNLMVSTSIRVRFTIHDSIATGIAVYREVFTPTTNALGVFNVNIGTGTSDIGTLSTINWATNAKFMQVELDPIGGTSYTDMGTQQMMSVAYSLMAQTAISAVNSTPVGSIIAYAGATAPAGWLLCDGRTVNSSSYPALYTAIGTAWGNGTGSAGSYSLPDLRGKFLRGVDNSPVTGTAYIDTDRTTRTAIHSGGNTGNNVGSYQRDTIGSINSTIQTGTPCQLGGVGSGSIIFGGYSYYWWNYHDLDTGDWTVENCNTPMVSTPIIVTNGHETRPKNANVYYIIKY